MARKDKSGVGVFYDGDDTPEIRVRIGKNKGKGGCAKVKVEFEDGSTRSVRICEDSIEEYQEE
jgi:hypothetical protein